MGAVKRLRDTKIKVIGYLKAHKKAKEYRDNDEKLVARFWSDELQEKNIIVKDISGYELLKLYATGKLTPADVISRARRKAQEECIELRGENWRDRHKEEEQVRSAFSSSSI